MAKSFEDFEPMFGEAKGDWEPPSSDPLRPFLFYVHALESSRLRIQVSDFHSYTWESVLTILQLEDLRDNIGVGGSWSEFIDYLIASISSDNVKLVLGRLPKSTSDSGAAFAKFVAHKSKGMPLVSISLNRLMNSSANGAMANLSIELFKAFKNKHDTVVKEQERSYQLTKILSAEQEKCKSIQNQLDSVVFSSAPKLRKISDKAFPVSGSLSKLDAMVSSDMQQSSETRPTQDVQSLKVGSRVVPAYRRAKVRGAVLPETDDSDT